MKVIGCCDLTLDYYFKNGEFLGVSGSSTIANIMYYLDDSYERHLFCSKGNDVKGEIAIKDLINKNIIVHPYCFNNTNINFYNNKKISDICPYCNRESKKEEHFIDYKEVSSFVLDNDVVITDDINNEIINNKSRNILILNNLDDVSMLAYDELRDIIVNNYEIIYIAKEVYDFIKRKFIIDSYDLYELFNPKVLIIFRDYNGIDIIYDGIFEKKEYDNKVVEENPCGGFEAFFGSFLSVLLKEQINSKTISKAFIKASSVYNYVVKHVGVKAKVYKNINYKECVCKNIIEI